MSEFLTISEILAIHDDQIERFGGSHGLRDAGALEAALYRAQSGYYEDTIAEAAALWESLSQNHPFVDGNKRTAFAVVDIFLRLNGIAIKAGSDTIYEFLMSLYETNAFRSDKLESWLRKNTMQS